MKNLTGRCIAIIFAVAVFGLAPGYARQGPFGDQTAMAPAVDPHDLSGFWDLSVDSRQVPPANLASSATKAVIEQHAKADAKAVRWCNLLGMPFVMDPGRPVDIQQGTREMVIFSEVPGSPRHIYFDRATHISADTFDPTTNGDSIGHWEGDTLIVDTVGFNPARGMTAIPGGGFRTGDSHLVERYQLLENGALLSVQFTWTDPKVFKTPHTYEFHYYRMAPQYEPSPGDSCNPYDDLRAKFLGFPPAPSRAPSAVPGAR